MRLQQNTGGQEGQVLKYQLFVVHTFNYFVYREYGRLSRA